MVYPANSMRLNPLAMFASAKKQWILKNVIHENK
jgi:hypothetical protein